MRTLTEEDVKTALDLARGLRALDVTGCWGGEVVVAAVDAPRLETPARTTSVTTLSAVARRVERAQDGERGGVRGPARVSGAPESVKTLNAAGCRTLETFNAYAEVQAGANRSRRSPRRRREHRAHEYIWRARVDARRV